MTDIPKLTALQSDLIANWLEHKDFRKGFERSAVSFRRVYNAMLENKLIYGFSKTDESRGKPKLINSHSPSAKALKAFRMHDQRRALFPALDSLIAERETSETDWAEAVAKKKADDHQARVQFEDDQRVKKIASARQAFITGGLAAWIETRTDEEVLDLAEKIRHAIEFF